MGLLKLPAFEIHPFALSREGGHGGHAHKGQNLPPGRNKGTSRFSDITHTRDAYPVGLPIRRQLEAGRKLGTSAQIQIKLQFGREQPNGSPIIDL